MTENISLENVQFSPETLKKVEEIITRYPADRKKSALLPVLHLAQNEWNWLSVPVMDYVAGLLDIKPIEVYEVATFYTMFQLEPVGKYVLEVCRTGPCCLRGAENLLDYIQEKLGTPINGTSADGRFTIRTVECLAACGGAPALQVRLKSMDGIYKYYENLTPEKFDELVQTEWV